jgi:hypothetical protein
LDCKRKNQNPRPIGNVNMIIHNLMLDSSYKPEHRRSERFPVEVLAKVKWHDSDGFRIKQKAYTDEVNAHGGPLRMNICPGMNDIIELTNVVSEESVEGRVLAFHGTHPDIPQRVVVELSIPSETFWPTNLQLLKTTTLLIKLGQSLYPVGMDTPILKEFRRELDYICRRARALEKSPQLDFQRHSLPDAQSPVKSEHIRCAADLCNEVAIRLETEIVGFNEKGVAQFYRAIDRAHRCLERYIMSRKTSVREKHRAFRLDLPMGL